MPATWLLALVLQAQPPDRLAPPVEKDGWIIPAPGDAAEPVWGIKDGIAVGLWPTAGPRGLLRVYAPYLAQPRLRMINYIAIEPIVGDARGLSELEPSELDAAAGKAMWTANEMTDGPKRRPPWQPASGKIGRAGIARTLTFFLFIEPFKNGARPIVQVTLRADRPYEVGLKVFVANGSAGMKSCVLTATMGNYARLRHLWLKGEVVEASKAWPDPRADRWGFAPPRRWSLDRMLVANGEAIVAATPNEEDPARAAYADEVPAWWRYEGKPATQYWRTAASKDLVLSVNARKSYWGGQGEIPGGVAYENFELIAPFEAGQEFVFGVTSDSPDKMGFDAAWKKNLTGGR